MRKSMLDWKTAQNVRVFAILQVQTQVRCCEIWKKKRSHLKKNRPKIMTRRPILSLMQRSQKAFCHHKNMSQRKLGHGKKRNCKISSLHRTSAEVSLHNLCICYLTHTATGAEPISECYAGPYLTGSLNIKYRT